MNPHSTPPPPLPRLAITMGDPTGIGPEVIAGALGHPDIYRIARPLVVGTPEILEGACRMMNAGARVVTIEDPSEFDSVVASTDCYVCLRSGSVEASGAPHGRVDPRGGQAAYDYLITATKMALTGLVEGVVTAPLHKAALHAAGHFWPGHTELLAHLCGVTQFAMMLYLPPDLEKREEPDRMIRPPRRRGGPVGLGMVHVTLHMSLREVFSHLTTQAVFEKITLAHDTFSKLRIALQMPPSPALAVAALNPHAGEDGLFGDEEATIIAPAVALAQARGWNVKGPFPVDTLMPHAVDGDFDAVIAMYHDQGHITLKLLDMFDAVNITLGLPIVRTSVAHGTAHDQAWRGTASFSGMIQAIRTAAWLAGHAKPASIQLETLTSSDS